MNTPLGAFGKRIEDKLEKAFNPLELKVIDESEKHRGHGGYREGGESHFHVEIVSENFTGLNRVKCQQLVYKALAEEMQDGIHALSMKTTAP